MSNRILTDASVSHAPSIVSEPIRVIDDATRDAILAEAEAAYTRGVADGRRSAVDEARAEAAVVANAVQQAGAAIQRTIDGQHATLADALGLRVLESITAVMGREPTDDGRVLLDRLQAAIHRTDEVALTVRVAGERQAVAAEALAGRPGITVEVDDILGPDDAIVTGSFARLDLRTASLLDALSEVLEDAAPLGPLPVDDAAQDAANDAAAADLGGLA